MLSRSFVISLVLALFAAPVTYGAVSPSGPGLESGAGYRPPMSTGPLAEGVVGPIVNLDTSLSFPTIQDAINDASTLAGHVIEVQTTPHSEGIVAVTKGVTLQGQFGGEVILATTDTGSSGDARGWFLVETTASNFTVRNLAFDGNGFRIWQGFRIRTGAADCSFENCSFNDIQFDASTSYAGNAIVTIDNNMSVTGCSFSNIGRHGIFFFGTGVTAGAADNNNYVGKGVGDWLDYGIELGGGAVAALSNNTITECRGVASSDGSTSAAVLITTFFGAGTAATLNGNVLTGNSGAIAGGYDAADTSDISALDNALGPNDSYTISNTSATTVHDASGNWLGSNDPVLVAASISGTPGGVDYSPWLDSGTDTDAGTAGFQGDFSTLWVDDDSAQSAAAGHIQEGIDLVTASTVRVVDGTYAENVQVTKAVDLLGPNAGICANDPTDLAVLNPARGPEALVNPASGAAFVIDPAVDDVTIDGFAVTANIDYGVYAWNAPAPGFDNIAIVNNRFEGLAGWAINSGGADRTNWTIACNRMIDWTGADKTAIWLAGLSNSGVQITQNYIRNNIGVAGARGVILDGGINAEVTDNRIEELTRYAIQLNNSADNVLIDGNVLSDVQVGLQLLTSADGPTGVLGDVVATNNAITDVTAIAIWLANATTGGPGPGTVHNLLIQNNTINQDVGALVGDFGLIDLRFDPTTGPHGLVTVDNNAVSLSGVFGAATAAHGIKLRGNLPVVNVTGNSLDGGGVGDPGGIPPTSGIYIQTDDGTFGAVPATAVVTLDGNTVANFVNGLSVYDPVAAIYGNLEAGADVSGSFNDLSGNAALAFQSGTGETVVLPCNWWGDLGGPDAPPANPNPAGAGLVGPAVYWPWLDAAGGNCDQFGGNNVAATPDGDCISIDNPCETVSVDFNRTDTSDARAASVTFQLSSEIELCTPGDPSSSIAQGSWLVAFGSQFQIVDNGGGSYTVDQAILGVPCGVTTGGQLFTVDVRSAGTDGVGTITITDVKVRDCNNAPLAGIPGAPALLTIDTVPPTAVADLVASQIKTGNGTDGTTEITLDFTDPGDADAFEVWRAPFGFYPEYDDAGGAVPAMPATYPPPAPWTPTSVTASGQVDEPADRDFWYYVVFALDACGNAAVSNMTAGTLNYHLGDVSDGATPGQGDNLVSSPDISLLGANYGISIAFNDPVNYLDVGPTADFSVDGRPATDDLINFEDLILFAINFAQVSLTGPPAAADLGGDPRLRLVTEERGQHVLVRLILEGNPGNVKGIHAVLEARGASVVGVERGALLEARGDQVFFATLPEAAVGIHTAILGPDVAFHGDGEVARITLAGSSQAEVRLAVADMRDPANRTLGAGSATTGIDAAAAGPKPARYELVGARPNPFNPSTTITFRLPERTQVELTIYDGAGRLMRQLVHRFLAAGEHGIAWDGRDQAGKQVGSGVYFYTLRAGEIDATEKLVLLK